MTVSTPDSSVNDDATTTTSCPSPGLAMDIPNSNGMNVEKVNDDDNDNEMLFTEEEKLCHLAMNEALLHERNLELLASLLQNYRREQRQQQNTNQKYNCIVPNCFIYTPVLVNACSLCCGKTLEFGVRAVKILLSTAANDDNLLSNVNVNVNAMDPESGFTALHWAAALNCTEVMHLLFQTQFVNHSINVNARCIADNETPLHRAARFGAYDAVVLLLDNKANPMMRNRAGKTPLDVVASAPSVKIQARQKTFGAFFQRCPQLRTLVLHHRDCLEHRTIKGHQEAVERIPAVLANLGSHAPQFFGPHELTVLEDFDKASYAAVRRVHSDDYVDFVWNLSDQFQARTPRSRGKPQAFTPRVQQAVQRLEENKIKPEESCDTNFSEGSLNASLRAAGSVICAINRIVRGESRNAFCAVRPPGHHAGVSGHVAGSSSCGFCIFNSVAIGALDALEHHKEDVKKVAIVDIDVHHGNGTEEIIKKLNRSEELFFCSTHLYDGDFYPASGDSDHIESNVMNLPITPLWKCLPTGCGEVDFFGRISFRTQIAQRLLPTLRAFSPDLILVSAGYDGCKNDIGNKRNAARTGPIGLDLSKDDYSWVIEHLKAVADIVCKGRIVVVLEGGYGKIIKGKPVSELSTTDLSVNAALTVQALVGSRPQSTSPNMFASTSKKFSSASKSKKYCETKAANALKKSTRSSVKVDECVSAATTGEEDEILSTTASSSSDTSSTTINANHKSQKHGSTRIRKRPKFYE